MTTIPVLGLQLFVMVDVSVGPRLQAVPPDALTRMRNRAATPGGAFETLMNEGSAWLFFDHRFADEHRSSQQIEVVYGDEISASTPPDARDSWPLAVPPTGTGGTRLVVQPSLGIGVLTFWTSSRSDGSGIDALEAKRHAADNQPELARSLEWWGLDWSHVGRITTVLEVQVDTEDLDETVAAHAVEIGCLFTGNLEDERHELLAAYAMNDDISGRRFERIYVRWSDALAVHDRTTTQAAPAAMRLARLVETGILMRRLLREAAFETEQVSRSIRPWTMPWLSRSTRHAERLRQTAADAELMTSVAPPTHSVEGERLLARTLDAFDIPELHASVRSALFELDRRLAWQRLKWLAWIAVLAFVLNTALTLFA